MNPRFKYHNDIEYPKMESHTSADGKRVYYTPFGPAPSVTTIISSLPHPGLDAWRERVGDEEADRVCEEAKLIGTHMHDMLEAYLRGQTYERQMTPEDSMAAKMFRCVRMLGLRGLQEVWGLEVGVYCHDLWAGTTDLVGVYEGVPSIIDYKTSIFWKRDEYIEDYRYQIAAYAIAHEEMLGSEFAIKQGIILISTRPNVQYGIPPKLQKVVIREDELQSYKLKWMDIVEEYHQKTAK